MTSGNPLVLDVQNIALGGCSLTEVLKEYILHYIYTHTHTHIYIYIYILVLSLSTTSYIQYLIKANKKAKLAIAASPPDRQSIATHFFPGTRTLYLTPA